MCMYAYALVRLAISIIRPNVLNCNRLRNSVYTDHPACNPQTRASKVHLFNSQHIDPTMSICVRRIQPEPYWMQPNHRKVCIIMAFPLMKTLHRFCAAALSVYEECVVFIWWGFIGRIVVVFKKKTPQRIFSSSNNISYTHMLRCIRIALRERCSIH